MNRICAFLAVFLCWQIFANARTSDTLKIFQAISESQAIVEDQTTIDRIKHKERLKSYDLYTVNRVLLRQMLQSTPSVITLNLPTRTKANIIVSLKKKHIIRPEAKIMTSSGKRPTMPKYVAYNGSFIGADKKRTLVSVIIFENNVACMISNEDGNYSIGRMKEKGYQSKIYIGSYSTDAINPPVFTCGVVDDSADIRKVKSKPKSTDKVQDGTGICKVVGVYVELTHEVCYDEFMNDYQQIFEYSFTLFNLVGAFYGTSSIEIEISNMMLWDDVNDPYPNNDKEDALDDFEDTYTSPLYGNIALLITTHATGDGRGGIANLPNCFQDFCDGWYGYADVNIEDFYGLPNYTWDVNVVAHELGHTMNSRHTHWCGWPGGALDGCVSSEAYYHCPVPGVTWCSDGSVPAANEGTVMSYCHNAPSVGINFSMGLYEAVCDCMKEFIEDDPDCLYVRTNDWYVQNQEFLDFAFSNSEFGNHTLVAGRDVYPYTAEGDVVVKGSTVFGAGRVIILKDGFRTSSTDYFLAKIYPSLDDCEGYSPDKTIIESRPSIQEQNLQDSEIKIYPNPANSFVNIEFDNSRINCTSLKIQNALGQVLFCFTTTKGYTEETFQFDTSMLNNGVYVVKTVGNQSYTAKFVVLH